MENQQPLKLEDVDELKSYEILEMIGSGGMGTVYKARHKIIGQLVAIKKINEAKSADAIAMKRFVNEAKAASRLKHQNLAGIREFGIDSDGNPFAVMDFAEGCSLSDLIKNDLIENTSCEINSSSKLSKGNLILNPDRILDIVSDVANGLQHAHSQNIIHRDIKPSNIIVSHDANGRDQAIVVDFGIAKIHENDTQNLTQTGEVYGSPYYLSPEQAVGMRVDHRSDFYSLGCVIFECLSGRPPFLGESPIQTAMMHLNADLPSLPEAPESAQLNPQQVSVYKGLAECARVCLQKDPANRYQNANELIEALESVKSGRVLKSVQKTRRRSLAMWIGGILMAVLIFIGVILGFLIISTNLARNQSNESLAADLNISKLAKVAVAEDQNRSLSLFQQGKYMESAFALRNTVQILEPELDALNKQLSATHDKKTKAKLLSDTRRLVWFLNESSALIGKCYLYDKNYSGALPYYEKACAFFENKALSGWGDNPSYHTAFDGYMTTLRSLGDPEGLAKATARYAAVKRALKRTSDGREAP